MEIPNMKYLLSFALVLILIGAGCAPEQTPAPGLDITLSTPTGSVTTQKVEINAVPVMEDGVPVTEIILGGAPDVELDMKSGNFFFAPNEVTVKQGETVAVTFTENTGNHTFVIDELNIRYEIKQGETYYFTVPDTAASYAFYCDIGSHRQFGMEGTLTVE